MKKLSIYYLIVLILSMTLSCSNQPKIRAGSICTVENGDGKFGIVKILVIDDEIIHVKIYKNQFDKRPSKIDIKTLSVGTLNDKDGFGVGHAPLEKKGFYNWKPIEVGFETVTKDDLIGYEIWKDQ